MTHQSREPQTPFVPAGQIDHHRADMTVTFAADVALAALQAALTPHAQWMPIDGDPAAPLGELVLRNSTGPLRLGYGAWRDVLMGAQFFNGLGELISAGGRVIKNVAGYDLTKLLVGSGGVFGTPATLTARTWRRPGAALHVTARVNLLDRLTAVIASPLRPHWMLLEGEHVMLGYHGDEAAVAFYKRETVALEPVAVAEASIEQDSALRASKWNGAFQHRISVAPARVVSFINDAGLGDAAVADPAFGVVAVSASATVNEAQLRDAARKHGATVIHWNPSGQQQSMQLPAEVYNLLQRLKTAFDPEGTLPGLPPNQP